MTPARLHHCHPMVPCAVCRTRAIETLLATGRPEMARLLARGLADAVAEEIGWALIWRLGRAQIAPPAEPSP